MSAIGSGKEQGAVYVCRVEGRARAHGIALGIDVLYHDGACRRAVASPELPAMNSVARSEEECAVNVRQRGRVRSRRTSIDVLHHDGSCRRAVTLPKLSSVDAVVGREKQRAVYVGEPLLGVDALGGTVHAGIDVLDQNGPCGCTVASPQLATVDSVKGSEEEGAVNVY